MCIFAPEMNKSPLTNNQKIKAWTHLAIIVLMVAGLIFCACRIFISCGGERHSSTRDRKHEAAWNDNYKDHREPVRSWPSIFNDLQETQLAAAQKNGINASLTREDVEAGKYDLTYIETCDHYVVDELTHSVPYLVPKAATLVDEIGKAFQDSLYVRGYNRNHRIIVTSVTRTRSDVQRLQRQNANATENSCHCYATTVDITYNRFDKPEQRTATDEKLVQLLMQTVDDFRNAKRCYVKYERKQACLHITVR